MALLPASNDFRNKTKKYGQNKQTEKRKTPTNQAEVCAVVPANTHETDTLQTTSTVTKTRDIPGCWARGTR